MIFTKFTKYILKIAKCVAKCCWKKTLLNLARKLLSWKHWCVWTKGLWVSSLSLGLNTQCNTASVNYCGAFPLHGTARYGSVRFTFGGFSTGYCTWYFFNTTSAEVPSEPYRYQNVTCKLYWSLIGRRKSSLLRHWTCDTETLSTALPARFKSAPPAKDRTQLLFKQTHIFASTTK